MNSSQEPLDGQGFHTPGEEVLPCASATLKGSNNCVSQSQQDNSPGIDSWGTKEDNPKMMTESPSIQEVIPLQRQLEVYQQGLDKLLEFCKINIEPYVDCQIKLSPRFPQRGSKDSAITGTYYRMVCWLQTLSVLKTVNHFQAAGAGARTLFELLIDLVILEADNMNDQVEKFHVYSDLEKLRFVELSLEVQKIHPNDFWLGGKSYLIPRIDTSVVDDIHSRADKLWINNKGKSYAPPHWSGKNLKTRVTDLKEKKYIAYFNQVNKILSWSVHPGAAVYDVNEQADLINYFSLSIHLARKFFVEGVRIFARYMKIGEGVENFYRNLDAIEAYPRETLKEEELALKKKTITKP